MKRYNDWLRQADPSQANVVGGYIESYGISATNFTSNVLSLGTNNVTAYFWNVGSL